MFNEHEKWMTNVPIIFHGNEIDSTNKEKTKRGSGFSSPRTPVYSFRMHDLIRELEKLERMTNTLLRKVFNSKKTLLKSESKRIPFEEAVTYRFPLTTELRQNQLVKIILIDCSHSMGDYLYSLRRLTFLKNFNDPMFFLYHRESIFSWSNQLSLPAIEGATSIMHPLKQLKELLNHDTTSFHFSIEHISDGKISTIECSAILHHLNEYASKGHYYTLREIRKQGLSPSFLGEEISRQFSASPYISSEYFMV